METLRQKTKTFGPIKLFWWVLLVIVVLFFVHRGLSQQTDDVKPTMHQILGHFLSLKPFLSSDKAFTDPKNAETIASQIKSLSQLAGQAVGHIQLQKLQYQFSRQALQDQFQLAGQAFQYGNKSYAREALNSSLSLCMSCHTQLPAKSRPANYLPKIVKGSIPPEGMYEQAEMLYVMWEFDWALTLYDEIIAVYPLNQLKSEQVRTALERKLTIFARIKRDPLTAIASFKKDLQNHKLPSYLKKDIRSWIKEFQGWSEENKFDVKNAGDDELHRFITENLFLIEDTKTAQGVDSPHLVTFLKISGILYEYLNTHQDTKLKPDILYWLGLCDGKTNWNFLYSLSDLYFKECILTYPKNPIAKKCFDEYKKKTLNFYLLHHENQVPKDIQSELDRLEATISP